MIVAEQDKKLEFLKTFNSNSSIGSISSLNSSALAALETLSVPNTRMEKWKYTRTGAIINKNFSFLNEGSFIAPKFEQASTHLVFVNGFFDKNQSSINSQNGLTVEDLTNLSENSASIAKEHLGSISDHEEDFFSALNGAHANGGSFIHVAKNIQVEKTIFISNHIDGNNVAAMPRHLFIAEEGSELNVVILQGSSEGSTAFHNGAIEAFVAPNARVKIDKIQDENPGIHTINREFVRQQKDSFFQINSITKRGDWVRNDLRILVDGTNCETHLNGTYRPRGKQLVDNHTVVDHLQPHCFSSEKYKGILYDESTGVFNGKVFVRKDAQKTNAFQQNANIVMDENAAMNSKPELEIYADDVKCSHGSTTGQFDEEAVFYLRARGIGERSARELLVQAFLSDVFETLIHPELLED